jgi:flavin reductase (DIM6/NTAB) family NADH-FMN oxidoreductase RutF
MSFDSGEFRNALGNFTTGICVVTTHSDDHTACGMTINSFASVSLTPPLVLWSLQDDSHCLGIFESAETFVINVLAADQHALSSRYATKDSHQLDPQHYRIGVSGEPVIRGALASFECRRWAQYPGGDHIILVGEVVAVEHNSNKAPLVFNSGQYRELR